MFTLAIVLGSVGALLILVGLIGGDFTFSGSVIPKVGKVSRVLSFTVGGFLVLSALSIVVLDSSNSGQTSANPAVPQSSPTSISHWSNIQPGDNEVTGGAYSATDEKVVSLLSTRPSFQGVPGAELVSIAHAECGVLQRGGHGSDVVTIAANNGLSVADASYSLGVSVAAYCPDYLSAATQ